MDRKRLVQIQEALRNEDLSGWLFYDFRGSDPLAYSVLGLSTHEISTRRWYYFIPARGEPTGIVSTVEPHKLDQLCGRKIRFFTWEEHDNAIASVLVGSKRIAMQYSPRNAIPYISRVDAGTIELVRQYGVEVVSSADLIQVFEAVWSEEQLASHLRAASAVRETVEAAFVFLRQKIGATEYQVQQFILNRFEAKGFTTRHPPVVAVNANSADPHYTPLPHGSAAIRPKDFVLIDLWAKEVDGVYADITWTGYMGKRPPMRHQRIFSIVREARDAAISLVKQRIADDSSLFGHEVDEASRSVIDAAGYGSKFFHRTGHSIGEEVHGNGANIDSVETRDTRRILSRTCFSIEPGIYLEGDFGVRSEVDIYVGGGEAKVTGGPAQTEIIPILN